MKAQADLLPRLMTGGAAWTSAKESFVQQRDQNARTDDAFPLLIELIMRYRDPTFARH